MISRKEFLDKVCLNCGKSFNRGRSPSGRLESTTDFEIRVFCSSKCSQIYKVGAKNPNYRRGYRLRPDGYCRLGDDSYIHRVLVEKFIGRKLKSSENIHHIDGNPANNDIGNLQIMTNSEHRKLHVKNQKRNKRGFCK